jgi:phage tail sheath gpL-like
MVFFGNTQASLPGSLFIDTGNASTAATNFRGYNNNALLQATSNGNTGVGTGFVKVQCTDAATTAAAAGFITLGGAAIAKGVVSAQMCGTGVASTATAAGTTTLTISSAPIQIFTGATTQTIQFPAANLFGAGISVKILVINRSSGTVTPTRAGADTFVGGGTTDPILTTLQVQYVSDGVSVWYKLAV